MTATKPRTFEAKQAVRTAVPLWIGLMGPSGTGKTFSALRLATGIQRVTGGSIYVIDTESRRALHYADQFDFMEVEFGAPFSPLDYLDVVDYCIAQGAKVIVIDSMSHEHEGPGGVLEWHEREVERLSGGDPNKAERVKLGAWAKPKAARRRFLNTILQKNANFIFGFRAKEKLKVVPGKPPDPMGFQPIAGDEYLYEMTVNLLLLPGSNGVPVFNPEFKAEKEMVKRPIQFADVFRKGAQLDEAMGEAMARWAAGGPAPAPAARTAQPAQRTSQASQQPTGGPARIDPSGAQMKKLQACLNDAGFRTREDRHEFIQGVLGRQMKSATELTVSEAARCIDALERLSNPPPADGDEPDWLSEQSEPEGAYS